jgi:alkaline phosphatase D
MYFDEPDHGHTFGPLSDENKIMVQKMDSVMVLLSGKDKTHIPIGEKINLIIVSDHGYEEISDNKKWWFSYLKPS